MMRFTDSFVIFSPRRGIKKFITFSLIVSLGCNLALLIMFLIFGEKAEPTLSFQAFMLAFTFSIISEIISAGRCMWGISSKDSKRSIFLRTLPDMERVIGNALICDELRHIVLCAVTCGASCAISALIGYYKVRFIIPAYIYQAALMYITVTVGTYIMKRMKKGSLTTVMILEYILVGAGVLGNYFTVWLIYGVTGFFQNMIIIGTSYVIAAAVGIKCFRSAKNRALRCRYADGDIKEGT